MYSRWLRSILHTVHEVLPQTPRLGGRQAKGNLSSVTDGGARASSSLLPIAALLSSPTASSPLKVRTSYLNNSLCLSCFL